MTRGSGMVPMREVAAVLPGGMPAAEAAARTQGVEFATGWDGQAWVTGQDAATIRESIERSRAERDAAEADVRRERDRTDRERERIREAAFQDAAGDRDRSPDVFETAQARAEAAELAFVEEHGVVEFSSSAFARRLKETSRALQREATSAYSNAVPQIPADYAARI